jgi:hypothetical protein
MVPSIISFLLQILKKPERRRAQVLALRLICWDRLALAAATVAGVTMPAP